MRKCGGHFEIQSTSKLKLKARTGQNGTGRNPGGKPSEDEGGLFVG